MSRPLQFQISYHGIVTKITTTVDEKKGAELMEKFIPKSGPKFSEYIARALKENHRSGGSAHG